MNEDPLKEYKEALSIFERHSPEIKCPREWCPRSSIRIRTGSSKHRKYFQCRGCGRSLKDNDIIRWYHNKGEYKVRCMGHRTDGLIDKQTTKHKVTPVKNEEGQSEHLNDLDDWKEKIIQNRMAINMIEEDMRRIDNFFSRCLPKKSKKRMPFMFSNGSSYLTMAQQVRENALATGKVSVIGDDNISLFPESEDEEEMFY